MVQLDHTGHLTERQVLGFLEGELPLGAQVQLDVRFQPQTGAGPGPPAAAGGDNG